MVPIFLDSAGKHGYTREEAEHAIEHAVGYGQISSRYPNEINHIFIGPPGPYQTRLIEVFVAVSADAVQAKIFHVMDLRPKYRYLLPQQYQ